MSVKLIALFASIFVSWVLGEIFSSTIDSYYFPKIQKFFINPNYESLYKSNSVEDLGNNCYNSQSKPTYKIIFLVSQNEEISRQTIKGKDKAINSIKNKFSNPDYCNIKIVKVTENDNLRKQARYFINDPSVLAVIGYSTTPKAKKVIELFNKNKLVLLLNTATGSKLIANKKYIFRAVNDNYVLAKKIVELIDNDTSFHKIVILWNKKDEYSNDMFKIFDSEITRNKKIHDYQLNQKYGNLKDQIKGIVDKNTAIVFFAESGIQSDFDSKFNCDIGLNISNSIIVNQSQCNAIKLIRDINEFSGNPKFFTSDSFYTFIQLQRNERIFEKYTNNHNQNFAVLNISLPWYDCESKYNEEFGWRYVSSEDSVNILVETIKNILKNTYSNDELRIKIQENLLANKFFRNNGNREREKNEIKPIIVEINPNKDRDKQIYCLFN